MDEWTCSPQSDDPWENAIARVVMKYNLLCKPKEGDEDTEDEEDEKVPHLPAYLESELSEVKGRQLWLITNIWPNAPPFAFRPITLVYPSREAVLEAFPNLCDAREWEGRLFYPATSKGVAVLRELGSFGDATTPTVVLRCKLVLVTMLQNFGTRPPDLIKQLLSGVTTQWRKRLESWNTGSPELDLGIGPTPRKEKVDGPYGRCWSAVDKQMGADARTQSKDEKVSKNEETV